MTIGERLIQLRERKNLKQSELAKLAKVPVSTISMVEGGVRPGDGLSVGTAKKIARALGVTLDYLVGIYDDEPGQPLPRELALV